MQTKEWYLHVESIVGHQRGTDQELKGLNYRYTITRVSDEWVTLD